MRFSLVIPVYNESLRLKVCLEAVFSQTRPFDEVIIVDNNSTDDSAEIARSFGATVVFETQQGFTYARNAGFDAASGDIIGRCDADTILPSDWARRVERLFVDYRGKRPLAAVGGPLIWNDVPVLLGGKYRGGWIINEGLMMALFGHPTIHGPHFAISAAAWHRIRADVCMDNNEVHEDVDISIHLARYGKIIYDPRLVVVTSGRRLISTPGTWLGPYFWRVFTTRFSHRPFGKK